MSNEAATIQIDQDVFQQTLQRKLADLPPLPAVVTRIMQTVNDPNTSAEDLNKLISLDHGLSSKLLRIVNSAYYGFPKRIGTITHAVVILGFNTVRNLVLGVSAFGMLSQKTGSAGLDRERFWEHSVAAAVAASLLARRKQPRDRNAIEESFLCGLLHDIGELFLDCYFPVQYTLTLAYAARESIGIVEAERKVLALDHVDVARRIGEHWNFPPSLVAAIGSWHDPCPTSEQFAASALVNAADWLAWDIGLGTSEHLPAPALSPVVRDWLAFSDGDFALLKADVETQFGSARDLLNLSRAA